MALQQKHKPQKKNPTETLQELKLNFLKWEITSLNLYQKTPKTNSLKTCFKIYS